jgi:hypothetical protein
MPLRRDAGRVLPGRPVQVSIDHPPVPACAPLSLSRCGPGLRSAPMHPKPQHSVSGAGAVCQGKSRSQHTRC